MNQEELRLNVAVRVPCTEAEGPGLRYALWVQGCPLRCPGCCNPHMLEEKDASWINIDTLAEEICRTPDIEGVTFLGGEPFAQAEGLGALAELVQAAGLSVMVFSGFTYEKITRSTQSGYQRLLSHIDLLVDGPYIRSRHVDDRRWIGSDNQQARFLTERYSHLRDSQSGWDEGSNTLEIRLRGDQLFINGFPHSDLNSFLAQKTNKGMNTLISSDHEVTDSNTQLSSMSTKLKQG
jgi:anaerobic ribonucleoside-triphosphate reductase activating protein